MSLLTRPVQPRTNAKKKCTSKGAQGRFRLLNAGTAENTGVEWPWGRFLQATNINGRISAGAVKRNSGGPTVILANVRQTMLQVRVILAVNFLGGLDGVAGSNNVSRYFEAPLKGSAPFLGGFGLFS